MAIEGEYRYPEWRGLPMMIWTEPKIMGSLFLKKTNKKKTYTGNGLEFNLMIDSTSSALIISATARRNFKGQYMR